VNEIALLSKAKDTLVPMLSSDLETKLAGLADELQETYAKRQIWRTQTEMMFSVLDDSKHPTPASKYWQCVREQSVFYEQLVQLTLDYRRNNIAILEIEEKLQGDDLNKFERMNLEVEYDSAIWARDGLQLSAKDRMRELDLWSQIKAALVEGNPEFDTEDVNTHQAESYLKRMENRKDTLTSGSQGAEVINVLGPLNTLRKLVGVEQTPYLEDVATINSRKKP
tara:strand:+ start:441 stop:1112 length:672 start_codon:yes stop_codon:yes gene_type:complete